MYPVPPYIAETALPAHVPEVIVLLLCPTPEIDEKFVVAVHKLPPIPTPPVTVKAPVDVLDSRDDYNITNARYFQLCQHDFLPWNEVRIVNALEELPQAPDNRGEGGFGSTGH